MKLFLELKLMDEGGTVHGMVRHEMDEKAAFIGERPVDDIRIGVGRFGDVVRMLRAREFRRTLLVRTATLIGGALANYLDDREGWNSVERQARLTVLPGDGQAKAKRVRKSRAKKPAQASIGDGATA